MSNLPKNGELPAVQFVSGLTNEARKVTLNDSYFFHNTSSPERVHQKGCGPKTPKKCGSVGGKSTRKSSSDTVGEGSSMRGMKEIFRVKISGIY